MIRVARGLAVLTMLGCAPATVPSTTDAASRSFDAVVDATPTLDVMEAAVAVDALAPDLTSTTDAIDAALPDASDAPDVVPPADAMAAGGGAIWLVFAADFATGRTCGDDAERRAGGRRM